MKKFFEPAMAYIAAIILLQTLYFKFMGAEESVFIFTMVGAEPWGRYATGVAELITGLMLFVPKTRLYGAFMGLGVISGAIATHLFILGITIEEIGDSGELFLLACIVFACCSGIVVRKKFLST